MSKPTIYIPMKLGDKFNVAFPDGFIPEGVIDKTKCRVGINYQAFHEPRHTIIVVPTQAIIDDAKLNYPKLNLFGLHGGVDTEDVSNYLKTDTKYFKIVTTPDSFWRIISAARKISRLQWLYKKAFLYLDEFHCYAIESYRDGILTPFNNDEVWAFKKKAFGSATYYPMSDPRFKKLQHYKLTYTEKFGTVNVIHDRHPRLVLEHMINHAEEYFPGPVVIWYNSVTQSGEVINNTRIEDAAVFCRDDEKNMVNLKGASIYYRQQPKDGEYKKFNFFSRRYDEGWALRAGDNVTIILITDIHAPHTLVGIPYQGFQAIGRLENPPHKIYHITNNYNKDNMRVFETIEANWLYNSEANVAYYNRQLKDREAKCIKDDGGLKDFITPYARFSDCGEAEVYHQKLDQVICGEWMKEHYSNKRTIAEGWEQCNYNTTEQSFYLQPIIKDRTSKENINRQVIERYLEWKKHPERYVYQLASQTITSDKIEFELLFQALEILGEREIARLNYNDSAMSKALIEISNKNAEAKIRLILTKEYKLQGKYTKASLKQRLQQLYDEFEVKKPNGTRKLATAEQFSDIGLFQMKECKAENELGQIKPGFQIVKLLYTLSMAA
jgi:hypothetical protein